MCLQWKLSRRNDVRLHRFGKAKQSCMVRARLLRRRSDSANAGFISLTATWAFFPASLNFFLHFAHNESYTQRKWTATANEYQFLVREEKTGPRQSCNQCWNGIKKCRSRSPSGFGTTFPIRKNPVRIPFFSVALRQTGRSEIPYLCFQQKREK